MSKNFFNEDYPILFPGAVKVFTQISISLVDPEIRLKETKSSIKNLINKHVFKSIVVCDGSNTSVFNDDELEDIYKLGINFEQIKFQQNIDDVKNYGKSNGEFQTVDYAIHNSKLINEAGGFYKLTPRYTLQNIEKVLASFRDKNNVFYHYNIWPVDIKSPFVMTIFYKCSLGFYKRIISLGIHECKHDVSGYIESIYYRLLNNKDSVPVYVDYPYFTGLAGTTSGPISNGHYALRNCASKLGLLAKAYK